MCSGVACWVSTGNPCLVRSCYHNTTPVCAACAMPTRQCQAVAAIYKAKADMLLIMLMHAVQSLHDLHQHTTRTAGKGQIARPIACSTQGARTDRNKHLCRTLQPSQEQYEGRGMRKCNQPICYNTAANTDASCRWQAHCCFWEQRAAAT